METIRINYPMSLNNALTGLETIFKDTFFKKLYRNSNAKLADKMRMMSIISAAIESHNDFCKSREEKYSLYEIPVLNRIFIGKNFGSMASNKQTGIGVLEYTKEFYEIFPIREDSTCITVGIRTPQEFLNSLTEFEHNWIQSQGVYIKKRLRAISNKPNSIPLKTLRSVLLSEIKPKYLYPEYMRQAKQHKFLSVESDHVSTMLYIMSNAKYVFPELEDTSVSALETAMYRAYSYVTTQFPDSLYTVSQEAIARAFFYILLESNYISKAVVDKTVYEFNSVIGDFVTRRILITCTCYNTLNSSFKYPTTVSDRDLFSQLTLDRDNINVLEEYYSDRAFMHKPSRFERDEYDYENYNPIVPWNSRDFTKIIHHIHN